MAVGSQFVQQAMRLITSLGSRVFGLVFLALAIRGTLRSQVEDRAIPRPLRHETFDALMTNSPFTRSLGISDSLILTGVARFDQNTFATLMDTRTMESIMVSRQPNREGWQLVGVGGDPARTQTWSAKIQTAGGEVVTIRYQKPPPRPPKSVSGSRGSSGSGGGNLPAISDKQIGEAKAAALNYKDGFLADGYPDKPPREMVEKLSRLSTSQREEINRTMFGHRNQGLGLDARRQIYEGLVDRALQRR